MHAYTASTHYWHALYYLVVSIDQGGSESYGKEATIASTHKNAHTDILHEDLFEGDMVVGDDDEIRLLVKYSCRYR